MFVFTYLRKQTIGAELISWQSIKDYNCKYLLKVFADMTSDESHETVVTCHSDSSGLEARVCRPIQECHLSLGGFVSVIYQIKIN